MSDKQIVSSVNQLMNRGNTPSNLGRGSFFSIVKTGGTANTLSTINSKKQIAKKSHPDSNTRIQPSYRKQNLSHKVQPRISTARMVEENTQNNLLFDVKNTDRFKMSSYRAMHPDRLNTLQEIFNTCFKFEEATNSISFKLVDYVKTPNLDVNFHRLLESFSVHIDEFYFKSNSKRLNLVFEIENRNIEFSLGKYRQDPTKPQVHLYKNGKMFKYEDFAFVKNNDNSSQIATYMNKLLKSGLDDISGQLASIPEEVCDDVLGFIVLTHIAEVYRPAEFGPLSEHDCAKLADANSSNQRILSRTPGSGKLTRSYIKQVMNNEDTFSIQSLNDKLPFVKKGGTSVQRDIAVGKQTMTAEQLHVESNMSITSDLFLQKQLNNGEIKTFSTCVNSSRLEYSVERCNSGYSCTVDLSSIDWDPNEPLLLSDLRDHLFNTVRAQSAERVSLDIINEKELEDFLLSKLYGHTP